MLSFHCVSSNEVEAGSQNKNYIIIYSMHPPEFWFDEFDVCTLLVLLQRENGCFDACLSFGGDDGSTFISISVMRNSSIFIGGFSSNARYLLSPTEHMLLPALVVQLLIRTSLCTICVCMCLHNTYSNIITYQMGALPYLPMIVFEKRSQPKRRRHYRKLLPNVTSTFPTSDWYWCLSFDLQIFIRLLHFTGKMKTRKMRKLYLLVWI